MVHISIFIAAPLLLHGLTLTTITAMMAHYATLGLVFGVLFQVRPSSCRPGHVAGGCRTMACMACMMASHAVHPQQAMQSIYGHALGYMACSRGCMAMRSTGTRLW